jgi:hypothetical protein
VTDRERIDALLDELGDAYHALDCLLDSAENGKPLDFGGQRIPEPTAARLASIYQRRDEAAA